MARKILLVDGVDKDVKEQLASIAAKRFGRANASLLVRHLIGECLLQEGKLGDTLVENSVEGAYDRVTLSLPSDVLENYKSVAEARITPHTHYMVSVLMRHVGLEQLVVDEIEVLRKSNYELAGLSINLNSIARAYGSLVKSGSLDEPEFHKLLIKLRDDLKKHTELVLNLLNKQTIVWDARHDGKGVRKDKGE